MASTVCRPTAENWKVRNFIFNTSLVRKTTWESAGGYVEGIDHYKDQLLWAKCSLSGARFVMPTWPFTATTAWAKGQTIKDGTLLRTMKTISGYLTTGSPNVLNLMQIVEILDYDAPNWVAQANFTPSGKSPHGLGISVHSVVGNLASIVRQNDKGCNLLPYVNFVNPRNLFYQQDCGKNIWNYWFQPIVPEDLSLPRAKVVPTNFSGMNHWSTAKFELGRRTWSKYVKPKPELQSVIDMCWTAIDSENVMAVHVRGTDKWRECTLLSPENWAKHIKKHLESDMPADKVLLVTDDPVYVNSLRKIFGDRICTLNIARTGQPLHYFPPLPPYTIGFQALTEALVAARCPYLLRAQSNFTSMILLAGNQKKVGLVGQLWDGDEEKWDGSSAT